MTPALPTDLPTLSLVTAAVDTTTLRNGSTAPNPLSDQTVACRVKTRDPPTLVPSDCGYILNQLILQEPGLFVEREFRQNTYKSEDGQYVPSRWQYSNCELTVHGPRHASQLLPIFAVALTADKIFRKCVTDIFQPVGGLALIGDMSQRYNVVLQGYNYERSESLPAETSNTSQQQQQQQQHQQPAVSVS